MPSNFKDIKFLHFAKKNPKTTKTLTGYYSMYLSSLLYPIRFFIILIRYIFHRLIWVAAKESCYQRDFLLPISPFTVTQKERASPCKLLTLSSGFDGFVCTLQSELLAKEQAAPRSVTALYCFTWSGKALHQTAGALQTAPPGPWGGHYNRDAQLKALKDRQQSDRRRGGRTQCQGKI